jgi:hypothetical protein
MTIKTAAFGAALALMTTGATANEFEPAMRSFLENEVRGWASHAVLIGALRTQNTTTQGYDQGTIDALDTAWRAEVGASSAPTIEPVLSNPAAEFLRSQVEASGGMMTEVILMDAVGLNAAVSHITSDMWQGDEAKYQETYLVGADAVHVSDIEKDESSGRYQGQVSFTVVDPASGDILGAMTVGVDADALF